MSDKVFDELDVECTEEDQTTEDLDCQVQTLIGYFHNTTCTLMDALGQLLIISEYLKIPLVKLDSSSVKPKKAKSRHKKGTPGRPAKKKPKIDVEKLKAKSKAKKSAVKAKALLEAKKKKKSKAKKKTR